MLLIDPNIAKVSTCPPATDTPTTGSMVTPLTPGRLSRSPHKCLSLRRQRSSSDSDLKSPKRKKQDDEQDETESNVDTLLEHEGPISGSHSQDNRTDSQMNKTQVIRMESQINRNETQEKITESQDNRTETPENRTESQVNEIESNMETSAVSENVFSVHQSRNESSDIQTGNEDAIHHESETIGNNQPILITCQTSQESFVPHLSPFVLGAVGGEQEEEGEDQFNDSCQFEMPIISAIVEGESEMSQLSTFDFNLQSKSLYSLSYLNLFFITIFAFFSEPDIAKSSVVPPPASTSQTVPPSSALFARPMLIPSSRTRIPIDEEKEDK